MMDTDEPGGRGRQHPLPGAGAISWLLRPDRSVRAVAGQLDAVRVLSEAGLLRPSRPDRLVAARLSLVRWGLTPAAGYATAAARYPDEPAIVDDNGTVTFAELDRRTGAVLLNTSFAGPQLAGVIRGERARVVIHDEEFTELLREGARRRRRFIAWHDTEAPRNTPALDRLAERHDGGTVVPPSRPGRCTLLTSGTTGAPKGASRAAAGGIAYVVRRDGAPLDESAVRGHVRDHLARYKVPRDVTFVDSLPRNAAGKVVKRELPRLAAL